MADYLKTIGSGDTMMIRDTGSYVEFWFQADKYTWNNQQDWGYYANGGWNWGVFKLEANGLWHYLGKVNITSGQNVTFRMYDEGLGWPTTDFTVFIDRAKAPDPPSTPTFDSITDDAVRVLFSDGNNNGAAIDDREIGHSYDSTIRVVRNADSGYTWSGLDPKKYYYFWARTHNAKGWSAWSGKGTVRTHGVPDAPSTVSLSEIMQSSLKAAFTDGWNGGVSILERQIGYGQDPNTPALFVSSNNTTISALDPGKTYYFWARNRNSYGWGPWSARTQATLVAGSKVNVAGVWKRAVPYVNVAGVWKLARPWNKSGGIWKETAS